MEVKQSETPKSVPFSNLRGFLAIWTGLYITLSVLPLTSVFVPGLLAAAGEARGRGWTLGRLPAGVGRGGYS